LGSLYGSQGEFDRAEGMFNKALALNTEMESKEGMAIQFFNLGLLYEQHGDGERAREAWNKALVLFKEVGIPDKIEQVQGLLAGLDSG
ncbi:MAG: tetratricopeptide repeat protein, partial [SAR324 cluster bacterium]|nr:tetratricopeptide repeat protein [SAR324 cluster bacterium]